ncbi:MAG: polysaccharide biosynthesis tyrosine autokinase [Cyanobacteria bacterium P01_F01_bin.143]
MFKIPNNNSQSTSQQEPENDVLKNSRDSIDIDVGAYLIKLKRRWKIASAIFFLTVGAAGLLSTKLSTKYEAEGKLLFKASEIASLTGVGENTTKLDTLNYSLGQQSPLHNQREQIFTSNILQKTVEQLDLKNEDGEFIDPNALKPQLKVDLLPGTDVIQVLYKDPNPEFAADLVNNLMSVYVEEQIRGNQSSPMMAKKFINQQIPQLKARVDRAESALVKFRADNKIVDLQQEKQTLLEETAILNRQIAISDSNYRGVKAQTDALQGQIGLSLEQAIAADQLGSTPLVNSIIDSMTVTENQLIQERRRFKAGHPNIVSLQEKKANLNRQLQNLMSQNIGEVVSPGLIRNSQYNPSQLEKFIQLKIQELSLGRQNLALAQAQQVASKRAKEIPGLDKKEQELLLELKIAEQNYRNLLDSLEQVELELEQETSNVEIVEPALVPIEGTSSRMKLLALGVMGGLFLSNAAVLLLETRDRSLKTISEIRKKLPYTILGIIPQDDDARSRRGVIVEQSPDSYTSEIYRMIRSNLTARNSQLLPKVILVTSSVPGEGKSTVTANLAAAISQLGTRVLLIDGDLRRPSQHRLWNRKGFQGIREVVEGETELADAIIQPMHNLKLLASGEVVSNPLAILDSPEMNKLIAKSRKGYDLVLIDAPPLPVTADILTLNKLVDGILFVSRSEVIEHESAELAQEILETIQDKVLGMVVNGVNAAEFDRYAYYATNTKKQSQKKFAFMQ